MTTQSNSNNSNSQEKKAGFTPGPWEVMGLDVMSPENLKEYKETGEKRGIVVVAKCGYSNVLKDSPEAKANARLIAQAPAMYEALSKVLGSMALERVERFDLVELCKEALQKAGGEK